MKKIDLMINGLPGKMASEVLRTASKEKFNIIPFSLTGEFIEENTFKYENLEIKLIKPDKSSKELKRLKSKYNNLIIVDFTLPNSVYENGVKYIENDIPFVMGTTGGDREKLFKEVKKSKISALIAPNMAIPIVAMQFMLENLSKNFPGIFSEFNLEIVESHQSHKVDTSGTAKSMVKFFNKLGVDFKIEDIKKIRDEGEQLEAGIPLRYINGHAYHTYILDSKKSNMDLSFSHNVRGRSVYAVGTLKGVNFLKNRIDEGSKGKIFNMIDVLKKFKDD